MAERSRQQKQIKIIEVIKKKRETIWRLKEDFNEFAATHLPPPPQKNIKIMMFLTKSKLERKELALLTFQFILVSLFAKLQGVTSG